MALEIPSSVERSHMNHPDFRVAEKIFASLGVPNKDWGMVKLTPDQQRAFIKDEPKVFKPASGAWGRQGYTNVYLPAAKAAIVRTALDAAAKNFAYKKQSKTPDINTQHPTPNDPNKRGGQPSQNVLEKCVLECWLKRTGLGFANSKLRSDFELSGAMDFHVHSAVLC